MCLVYTYWYQNPNKVVADALSQAINAKSFTYTGVVNASGAMKTTINLDGGASYQGGEVAASLVLDVQGRKYTLVANGLIDEKNDLYFKIKNFDELVKNYRKAIPSDSLPLFDEIIGTVNNKWVKVSSSDLRQYNPNLETVKVCAVSAAKKIQGDRAAKSEIMAMYAHHPFVVIDKYLGTQDGNYGYTLTTDQDKLSAFINEYKNTELYKALVKCDKSFEVKDNQQSEISQNNVFRDISTDVWINQWSHRLEKINIKDGGSTPTSILLEPDFNQPVVIATPENTITLERLQKDIQELLVPTPAAP
jgi:hypothetical protein